MRKNILTLVVLLTMGLALQAQDYNKWSIDADFGVNKPGVHMTKGYTTGAANLFHAGLSVRHMFNPKFGIRLGFDYDNFRNAKDKPEFSSFFYRPNAQFVINLGRLLGMEDFCKGISLLSHFGGGFGLLDSDYLSDSRDLTSLGLFNKGADKLLYGTMGITPQVKLAERVALFADVSMFMTVMGNRTFDTKSKLEHKGVDGYGLTASIGLNIYLGGKDKHADWYIQKLEDKEEQDVLMQELTKLKKDLATLKTNADDAQNNIADNEKELDKLRAELAKKADDKPAVASSDVVNEFFKKGLVNIYFDFDIAKPNESGLWMVNLVANYMKENPLAKVTLSGYADKLGNVNYNNNLSQRRADNVRKMLIDAGIDASRLTAVGKGVQSDNSRDLIRRVVVSLNK